MVAFGEDQEFALNEVAKNEKKKWRRKNLQIWELQGRPGKRGESGEHLVSAAADASPWIESWPNILNIIIIITI